MSMGVEEKRRRHHDSLAEENCEEEVLRQVRVRIHSLFVKHSEELPSASATLLKQGLDCGSPQRTRLLDNHHET